MTGQAQIKEGVEVPVYIMSAAARHWVRMQSFKHLVKDTTIVRGNIVCVEEEAFLH